MKPTRNRLISMFIAAAFCFSSVSGQSFINSLNTYNKNYPEEKLYVHFDKSVYSEGETIWFKAYLTAQNFPSEISTNVYVELLDMNGKLLQKKFYPVFESTAAGDFEIPKKITKEGVVFRAYTNWQLNFDSARLFTKFIRIVQPGAAAGVRKPVNIQLRFFPEGGYLLSGFSSTLAFAAADEDGLPYNVSGVIKDGAGKEVTSFHSQHDGMGKFAFTPQLNQQYYAEWTDPTGRMHSTQLPAAQSDGVILTVTNNRGYIGYVLKRSDETQPANKKVHVIAQMHQQMVYKASISLEQTNITSGIIKTDSLTSGILALTLFDASWKPLAERVVFLNKQDFTFPSEVHIVQPGLKKRAKNILEIEVPDTLTTNLSVSVTDAKLPVSQEDDIITSLFMSGELRGYIHNPRYYFSSESDSIAQELDLVMLTHGWRKYNWENIAAGRFPEITHKPDRYLTLKGKVLGVPPTLFQSGAQVNLIMQSKDSARQFVFAPIDKNGEFNIDGIIFFDTISVYYGFNANKKLNRIATVDFKTGPQMPSIQGIDTSWAIHFANLVNPDRRNQFFAEKRAEVIPELNKKIKTLEEVVVRSKVRSREEAMNAKYTSGTFQSENARSFNLLDDPFAITSMNALQYLQGRVPGLQIYGSGTSYSARWRGESTSFYIDEMPRSAEDVALTPVSDIALIKVFSPPFMGGFGGGTGGAIAIYTKKGGDDDVKHGARGLEKGKAVGYSTGKEFYSPDYAVENPLHEVEDVRSTLYWQPYILTDKNTKKVRIEFYNNDVSDSLRIILEGMNETGRVTRVEKLISR